MLFFNRSDELDEIRLLRRGENRLITTFLPTTTTVTEDYHNYDRKVSRSKEIRLKERTNPTSGIRSEEGLRMYLSFNSDEEEEDNSDTAEENSCSYSFENDLDVSASMSESEENRIGKENRIVEEVNIHSEEIDLRDLIHEFNDRREQLKDEVNVWANSKGFNLIY